MALRQHWRFLTGYLRQPNVVGAVSPSSQALAVALCEPFRRSNKPATVLEVGAGTGAITRHLGGLIGESDELDVCEIDRGFADILERDVLSSSDFRRGVSAGRVRLLRSAVQDLPYESRYDFIISGLPLTAFNLQDVREVFGVLRRCLKPHGVLSYFEYMGLRRTSRVLSVGRRRSRIRSVSAYLASNIREHQFRQKTVLRNLPPARARHLRFDGTHGPYRLDDVIGSGPEATSSDL